MTKAVVLTGRSIRSNDSLPTPPLIYFNARSATCTNGFRLDLESEEPEPSWMRP